MSNDQQAAANAQPAGRQPRSFRDGVSDPVTAALRGNLRSFSPRQRQGAQHSGALQREPLLQFAAELRKDVEAGVPLAIAACLGTPVGLTPAKTPYVAICAATSPFPPACYLDKDGMCLRYDLDRVLERSAEPKNANWLVPAVRWVEIPLPAFVAIQLEKRLAGRPDAATIADLVGWPDWEGRKRFSRGPGYRLKPTLARFRKSLGLLLLDAGVRRLVASAAVMDFRLGTKSNFAYITFPQSSVTCAVELLHRSLRWD